MSAIDIQQTLNQLGIKGIYSDTFLAYMQEDTLAGYPVWPIGSMPTNEAHFLYAMVRWYMPRHILEIGRHMGCSLAHMAMACEANKRGLITSVDKEWHRALIFEQWLDRVEFVEADAREWTPKDTYDFVLEDCDHSLDTTRRIWQNVKPKIAPNAVIVMHDWFELGASGAKQAFKETWGEPTATLLEYEKSSCGLAIKQLGADNGK